MRIENFNGIRRMGDDRDVLVTQWDLENEVVQVLKPMYRAFHDYILENGWTHPQSDDEIVEDLYWERWNPTGMYEQWIWWRFKLDVNEYIRYLVLFDWQTLFVKPDQKIQYKGKKVPGRVERINLILKVQFYLQFDIHDKFKNSIAWKFKKAFFNRMYQQEIEQHKAELHDLATKMQLFMKNIMALERGHEEWPAGQYGPLGYGNFGDDSVRVG